jgi:MYXO-CTERM domain-containing protein
MRHVITLGLSAVASLAVTAVHADTLHKESFEGCTGVGYSLLYGSFDGDDHDGIQCGSSGGLNPFNFTFSATVTGHDGNHYIGLEDLSGFGLANPNAVVLSDIDISGYGNLSISLLFAAPSPSVGRYEASDYLEVQYRVDGGSWVTVGRFFGSGSGNVGMLHDENLDGIGTTTVTNAMQRFTYALNNRVGQGIVTGSTLSVRIMFSSDGAQEEMAFDDIVVTGTPPAPIMNFSATTYSVNEDGTPSGAAVIIERSGSTVGATSVNVTFTEVTALGGGVDFNSTTTTVAFADGETSKTVALPVTDDAIDEGNETFTISLAANGSNAILGTTTSATVTIIDDDTAGVSVSSTSVAVSEAGETDSYSVVLTSQPTSNVEVDITSSSLELELSSGGGVAADSIQLLFTPSNWNVPQSVTVYAIDDSDVESNPHSDTLTHVVGSLDLKYDGISVSDVLASISDNDVCGDGVCNPTEDVATCAVDCTVCGDGLITGTEACDGAHLGSSTCVSLGFASGTLSCTVSCTLDISQCELESPESDAGADGGADSGTDSDFSDETTTEFTSETFVATSETLDSSPSSEVPDVSTSSAPSTSGGGVLNPTTDAPATSSDDATSDDLTSTAVPATSSVVTSDETSTFDSGETTIDLTSTSVTSPPPVVTPIYDAGIDAGETTFDVTLDDATRTTSNSDSTDSRSESRPPAVVTPIYDAGADAGDAVGSKDGCDCRVGARSSSSTGWFGLLLTGLIVARLRQRREGHTSIR